MSVVRFFVQTGLVWYRRDAAQHAASLAYFTLFALTPLIYFSLAIVGLLTGVDRFRELLLSWGNAINSDVTALLYTSVVNFTSLPGYYHVPVIGLLFLTAMIFVALSSLSVGLHKVWAVELHGWRVFARRLLRTVLFIILLQGYFVFAIWLGDVMGYLEATTGIGLFALLELLSMYLATVMLIAVAYSLLTVAAPSFAGRLVGAAIAGVLLLFSRELVALQFTSASVQSLYGAAGLLIVLLTWVYVTASIILFGAAAAKVYDETVSRVSTST